MRLLLLTAALVRKMNVLTGRVIISDNELQSVYSPLGFDSYMRGKAKGLEQHPKEIGALLDKLPKWRQTLRDTPLYR